MDPTTTTTVSPSSHLRHEESASFSDVPEMDERRMEQCRSFKEEGNECFKTGEFAEALNLYRKGIDVALHKPPRMTTYPHSISEEGVREEDHHCHQQQAHPVAEEEKKKQEGWKNTEEKPETEAEKEAYTLTAQLYANAAACLMRLDCPSLEEAVSMLSEAIHHQPDYQKAWLRRAECYYRLEKFPSAFADYEAYEKCGGRLDREGRQRKDYAKAKQEEEMKKMLGDLKEIGNKCLGWFGLSTDNFKFDKDPNTGSYSMRFER